ncbi:hypothetical protein KSP40_PGU019135 [Platanthera guangdongensis]|uniref:Dihydrodipicolinate reductase N-terminal domain-containing protein n=1 Tax=Platanthera guangdongensis TaxID=2320717 RepID=A0ABR2LYW2_9ASPA
MVSLCPHTTLIPLVSLRQQISLPEKNMSCLRRRCASASMSATVPNLVKSSPTENSGISFPILINGCTGKMGRAVADAAVCAGLQLIPVTFSNVEKPSKDLHVGNVEIKIHGPSERENVLSSILNEFPNLVVVDYTAPDAVNGNTELYCKLGVPFVMGTTGGERELLYKTAQDANVYAVISPQMGKQVMESHQAGKLDTSGTAKAVISCFQKLGVSFDMNNIKMIRDPMKQIEMVGVPEEHLEGHAFHMYHLTSPDQRWLSSKAGGNPFKTGDPP